MDARSRFYFVAELSSSPGKVAQAVQRACDLQIVKLALSCR